MGSTRRAALVAVFALLAGLTAARGSSSGFNGGQWQLDEQVLAVVDFRDDGTYVVLAGAPRLRL